MANYTPVDHDPFAAPAKKSVGTPVDYDPFAAAPKKAAPAAPKRSLGERFMDNVTDAALRNPTVAAARDAFSDPLKALPRVAQPGASVPTLFDALGPLGDALRMGISGAGMASRAIAPEAVPDFAGDERARRADYQTRSEADPFYRADGGLPGKAAAGASTLAGQFAGAATDPQNLVNAGGSLVQRALAQGGINAATDVAAQGSDINAGVQDQANPVQTLIAAVLGAGLGGVDAKFNPDLPPAKPPPIDPAMGPVEALPPVQAPLDSPGVIAPAAVDNAPVITDPILSAVKPVSPAVKPVSPVIPEAPPLPAGAVDPAAPPAPVAAMPKEIVAAYEGADGPPLPKPAENTAPIAAPLAENTAPPVSKIEEPPAAPATGGLEMTPEAPTAKTEAGVDPSNPASVRGVDDVEPRVVDVVPGNGQDKLAPIVADSRVSGQQLAPLADDVPVPAQSAEAALEPPKTLLEPAQRAEAKATDDLTDADAEALYMRNFGPDAAKAGTVKQTKLMSGVDPDDVKTLLLDPAVKIVKKEIDGFKSDAAQSMKDLRQIRENSSVQGTLDTAARTVRKVWWSNTAAIRAVAAKHPDVPEIRQLADHVGTDPGRGRVVEQTYERATQMRAMGMANRVGNVLGEKVKPEFEQRVADALAGRLKPVGGTGEETTARRLRKLLDEQHDYMTEAGLDVGYVKGRYYPRIVDEDAVLKDPIGFKEKAAEVYSRMGMTPEEAATAADDWYSRILGVTNGAYARGMPSSKATKGRTLPEEADEILKDFYSRDPRANLTAYFRQTSQAAEFARRFGPNGEKADELFNGMLKKGVDPKEVNSLRHHFESAAGLLYSTRPDAGAAALSWIQTAGVLRLLPRAVISSAVESLATGIRAHDVGAGFKGMADAYAEVFGLRAPDDIKATAEMLGIIGDAVNDLVIAANFGGEVGGQLQQKLLSRFFKTTQLHQITQAQRLAAARTGQAALRTMMQDVIKGNARQKSAARWLSELGIPEKDVPALSTWLSSDDGRLPFSELLSSKKEAVQYRTALQRFVDESIQNPTAADRPQWANHPYGKLAYGITSFMFSFTRNVLIRTGRETGEGLLGKGYSMQDRARLLAPALGLGVLTAAQSQVSEFREMLLNPGASDEKSKTQKVIQNLSRAGAFGNLDPLINVAMSARYNRDLTSTLTGPYLTAYLDSVAKMTVGLIPKEWGGPNTPNTNNAEWQAAKAAYEMIAAPSIAAAASYLPGGPILRVGYGAGIITATGPSASRGFADKMVGPRDVVPGGKKAAAGPEPEGLGDLEAEMDLETVE